MVLVLSPSLCVIVLVYGAMCGLDMTEFVMNKNFLSCSPCVICSLPSIGKFPKDTSLGIDETKKELKRKRKIDERKIRNRLIDGKKINKKWKNR